MKESGNGRHCVKSKRKKMSNMMKKKEAISVEIAFLPVRVNNLPLILKRFTLVEKMI